MLSAQDLINWFNASNWWQSISGVLSNKNSKFSQRSQLIRESNIRDAARLVTQLGTKMRVINLGQGLPEYPADDVLKASAKAAIDANFNQYSNTWGYPDLRQAVSNKFRRYNNIVADPETEVTVTCGASEAIHATLQAIVNPKDEVIIIEPFYENYLPDVLMSSAIPRYVPLRGPRFLLDEDELARAFNRRTRAIMVNTPHNPTGRVFTREELTAIARLCQKWNVVAISDEIYEYMTYGDNKHLSLATLPGMKERTITISGLSKTFSITGWRLGYMAAPADYTRQIRKLHDYITLAAPSPLQMAGLTALNLPETFYRQMSAKYEGLRNQLMEAATQAGFKFSVPEGTYYLFTDASHLGFENDRAAWEFLLKEHGLATVAGYCFFRPEVKTNYLRFCYAKYPSTIEEGAKRLLQLRSGL